jgi:PIN domain nuclease of toxin-antitoxin system
LEQPEVILVDTQVVLWLAFEPDKLSARARAAIAEERHQREGLAIVDVTLLELTILAGKGRIRLETALDDFLRDVEARFTVLPVSARVCAQVAALPPGYPKDPADRIIGATAIAAALRLVTSDREIRRFKIVPTLW